MEQFTQRIDNSLKFSLSVKDKLVGLIEDEKKKRLELLAPKNLTEFELKQVEVAKLSVTISELKKEAEQYNSTDTFVKYSKL